jgi:acetolactate synthase-1/2/3 large subunit
MPKYTGGQIIANYLLREDITHLFGVAGHGVLGLLDAGYDCQDRLKMIMVRHEQVAGFMADGYYRVSHRPAATFTSSGPGSINLLIAMAEAMSDSIPFFSISGDVATQQFNSGALQELYRQRECDFPSVVRHYVKQTWQVTRLDMLPKVLALAFKTMMSGRRGPVNIDVPYDKLVETADVELYDPGQWTRSVNSQTLGNPAAVAQAVDLLLGSARPLILAGHGVQLAEGWDELRNLAHQLGVPVITSALGKGLIPEDDPLALGAAGAFGTYPANEMARSADVILALGCRFSDLHTSSWAPGLTYNIPPTRLIQVDIDPGEIGRNYPVAVGIVGDCKMVLQQMLDAVRGRPKPKIDTWMAEVEKAKAEWETFLKPRRASARSPIQFERALNEARKALPANAAVFVDAGNTGGWVVQHWPALQAYTHQVAGGMNAMGWAPCAPLGAKIADPARTCMCICGDGSFTMTPHVLATAVEYNLPVIWLVLNDYSWGAIKGLQSAYFDAKEIATSFKIHDQGKLYNPDFALWAKACGAEGEQIKQAEDLAPALDRAVRSGRPYVLDVIVDRDEVVPFTGNWQMPPIPVGEPLFGKRKIR